MAKKKAARRKTAKTAKKEPPKFTPKQGQYLAYLYWYRKLHRQAPAESDIARYFQVSPPSAHQMIVTLEKKGLISREPGVARSIRVLLPYGDLPHLEDDEDEPRRTAGVQSGRGSSQLPRFYTLEVFLVGGPVPEEFAGKEISRTLQIRGDQTLEQLHEIIFQAYQRWDEHMYEFQFGRGPHDPDGKRYVLPIMQEEGNGDANIAGDLTKTTMDSLQLQVNQPFGYWFDYGDDWYHQIVVLEIDPEAPHVTLPRVIERVGASPPQYPDEEE